MLSISHIHVLPSYRSRLETNAEQWNQLLKILTELIDWITLKDEELSRQQPIGGDINNVKLQNEENQVEFRL